METFLIVQRGEDIGRRYDLDTVQLTIGRGSDNDMVLNDPMVSRYHAVVKRQGSRFTIIDLGSSNPVVVNDQVLEPGTAQQLQHRDVVFIGKTVFSFQSRDTQGQARADQPAARPAPQPAASPVGATQMMPAPAGQPAERQPAPPAGAPSSPPMTPTLTTPLPRPAGGADEGRTMVGGVFQGVKDGEADTGSTQIGAAGPRPQEPVTPPPMPRPNFPPPPPPAMPKAENEDSQTRPGINAPMRPTPPSGAAKPEEDKTIGTPPDDEAGDSPTVFIPRERR